MGPKGSNGSHQSAGKAGSSSEHVRGHHPRTEQGDVGFAGVGVTVEYVRYNPVPYMEAEEPETNAIEDRHKAGGTTEKHGDDEDWVRWRKIQEKV